MRELILTDARLYHVDPKLATRIASCESRLDPSAKNESGATGVYQFLKSSWAHYGARHWGVMDTRNIYDASDNIELAMWVMGNYGTHDWDASKSCWGLQ